MDPRPRRNTGVQGLARHARRSEKGRQLSRDNADGETGAPAFSAVAVACDRENGSGLGPAGGRTRNVSPQSSAGPDTAIIFDVQRFCVHDGPGVRTTVFFKGCPLACEWCQNPESLRDAPDLMVFGELCIKCGACAAVCAHSAAPGGTLPNPPPPQCDVCGRCVAACPAGARR
ncbi:MAG: 4Fe-4S cluster-binding domain-containing protein, partial [Lentisphaerae bacterium]|nr:4Fe-4S cluster-binding domain-containing protein [Lentisphaerota bacterium]